VRRGCISQGNIQCDSCGKIVPYAGRYMTVEEKDGVENGEGGETKNYCVKCCLEKKYAEYRADKGEKILTFFYEEKKLPQS
jgi:ribosomal protein S26